MFKFSSLPIAIVLSILTTGIAQSDPDHSQEADSENASTVSPMESGQHDNMQKMMRMRGGKMSDAMGMGQMGMMGGMPGMDMMDMDMMLMMMGKNMMGMPSAEKLRSTLQTRFEEFDTDSNGMLSIEEFEALHNTMTREMMMERFEHLDTDGDGQITSEEMGELTRRLEMCPMMSGAGGMMNGDLASPKND